MFAFDQYVTIFNLLSPGGSLTKNLSANAGEAEDTGSIPGSERSSGVGNGMPLQYSCLKNSIDRGAWWASPWGHRELDITEHTLTRSTVCASNFDFDDYFVRNV